MFCITLALTDHPVVWTLLYKTETDAKAAWENYRANPMTHHSPETVVQLTDDFGQTAVVDRARVAGAMFEDLDKSMLAHIERGLHNARTQAKAQQLAMNDPILKTAAMTQGAPGGPAIFSPLGNGHG